MKRNGRTLAHNVLEEVRMLAPQRCNTCAKASLRRIGCRRPRPELHPGLQVPCCGQRTRTPDELVWSHAKRTVVTRSSLRNGGKP